MKFPLLAKVGAIVLVGLMLTMVLFRIEGLVDERKARGEEAVRGVERSHAAAQSILGPVLERACTEEWDVATGTGKDRVVNTSKREFRLQQVPTRLAVDSRTKADPLWRGLFKVNAWVGHFTVAADFASLTPLQPHLEHADGRLQCGAPVLLVALSDVRGVRSATVSADGQALVVEPGTGGSAYANGLHSTLAAARVDGDAGARPLSAHLEIDLIIAQFVAKPPLLQQSNPVLTRQSATEFQAREEKLIGGAPHLVRHLVAVKDEVRMQIPVARVRHGRDHAVVLLLNLADRREHGRQLAARHRDILD